MSSNLRVERSISGALSVVYNLRKAKSIASDAGRFVYKFLTSSEKDCSFSLNISFSIFSRASNVDVSMFEPGNFSNRGPKVFSVYDNYCEKSIEPDGVVFHSYVL